jgi:gliding motility-associated-like protein
VNDAMDLSWQTQFLANFSMLNILRNDTILSSLSSAGTSYRDTTALCTNNYCYQVQVINSDGSQSFSEIVCGTAFSTTKPNSVTNVSTTIDNEVVSWSWQVPQNEVVDNFRIRDADGVVVSNTDQANLSLDLTDPITCIQFEFTNNCGNTSDRSRIFCPLLIDFQITASGGTLVSWAPYEGYSSGVNGYALLIYDQSMVLVDSLWLNTNLSYEDPLPSDDNQISFYRVIAEPIENSLAPSISNLLVVERPPVISLPSSFTPNGDGLNDLFEITGKYIMSQELIIFNRWGSILFSSNSEGWDGTAAGDKVEAGTYIYQVKVKDFAGKEHIRTGSVLILKD